MPEGMNVEISHKLSEHEEEKEKRKARWEVVVEIIEVAVLAIVAIATAWSGYQAARSDGQQSLLYGHATADRFSRSIRVRDVSHMPTRPPPSCEGRLELLEPGYDLGVIQAEIVAAVVADQLKQGSVAVTRRAQRVPDCLASQDGPQAMAGFPGTRGRSGRQRCADPLTGWPTAVLFRDVNVHVCPAHSSPRRVPRPAGVSSSAVFPFYQQLLSGRRLGWLTSGASQVNAR